MKRNRMLALFLTALLSLSLLTACGGKTEEEKVDLSAFAQTLTETYEISGFLERMDPEDPDLGALMLDGTFPGLKEMDLEQMEVYLCMVGFNTGEFSLVQAKNADDAKAVAELFQGRIDGMVQEGMNYPETIELWQKNSAVVTHGNYVMLVCAEDKDSIVSDFEALFGGSK